MSDALKLYRRGFGHFATGELADAIALYREAIEVEPQLAIAWNGLSMALAKAGDLDAGIEAARELVRLEPEDPLSHTNLSRLLQQKGMIPEAEDARGEAMRLQMKRQS